MNSVSCANTTHCWATGAAVSGGTSLAMSGTGNGGRSWSSVTSDATDQEGQVSCATLNFCVSTADNGLWVTHNDGGLSKAKLVSHPLPHLSGATVAARAGHSVAVTGQCAGCPGKGAITVKAPGKRATASRVSIGVNGFYSLTIKKVAKGTTTVRLSAANSKPRTVRVHGYSAAAPSVSSISQNAGPVTGGTKVIIRGHNFVRVSAVYFGSRRGTRLKVVSKTELTVVTPGGAQGRYVTVDTTNGGPSPATGSAVFNYLPVPAFISLSPDSGPAAGGTEVTITGTGFGFIKAVYFGGRQAMQVRVLSPDKLMVRAPAGTGTVIVRVRTAGGETPEVPSDGYSYQAPS